MRKRRHAERVVRAVHEHDLEAFLESVNLLEEALNNQLECIVCKQPLGIKEISRFIVKGESVLVVCDRPDCLRFMEGE